MNQRHKQSGQAILETVLSLPFLIFLLLNTINFGYMFISILNMTSGTRVGTEYAVMGSANTISTSLPVAGDQNNVKSVAYLIYNDIRSGMANPSLLAAVRVCTPSYIVSGSGYQNPTSQKIANCYTTNNLPPGFTPPALSASGIDDDLECPQTTCTGPVFSLSRVDIFYLYRPLIPGTVFNAALLGIRTCQTAGDIYCTFVRTSKMRLMGS